MIVLQANERNATAQLTGRLTSGSVGIPVTVILSDDYKDLAVTLCFRAGDARADVPYKPGDTVTVPAQCLRQANLTLAIGVRAESSDGTEVIPTIYATVGMIEKGARYSGINPEPPAPSWAAQVQTWANESRDAAVSAKDYAEDVHEWVSTQERITSLNSTELVVTGKSVEALGNPVYVSDVTPYSAYGITEVGWYVLARIAAPSGVTVSDATTVAGADGSIVTVGADHADVAVRFDVASMAKAVAVAWDADHLDAFTFRATDLAVRNLDYRTTFYVYDLEPFVTWEWEEATGAFVGTEYWEVDAESDIGHSRAAVITGQPIPAETYYTRSYALTTDATFQEGTVYYTKSGTVYTPAEVTPGAAVTANTYYVDVWTEAKGFFVGTKVYHSKSGDTYTPIPIIAGEVIPTYFTDAYELTADETFQSGTTYYTLSDGVYTAAEVTAGEDVPADTYYVHSYELVEGGTFEAGVTYYTKSGTTYTAAEVTAGEDVPDLYWQHSKLTIEGMVRNVTYKLDVPIDCPSVFVLPEVEDETHGCWYEMRFRHLGSYSSTMQVPEGVKVATEHTQTETAGVNMVDLHYNSVAGIKAWRFLNTHSSIPTT